MEFIDVLDENGNKTNIVRNKQLIYKLGSWHKSVHVWILNSNNELLLQKRSKNKETFPNKWAISIAGHVKAGETSLEAAKREVKEEINLSIQDNELIKLFSLKRAQPYKDSFLNVYDDVYLLQMDLDISKTIVQKEELTDIKFINFNEYEQRLKAKDSNLVPYSEEHELLFKYLRKKLNLGD